jgi:hypothetical protein
MSDYPSPFYILAEILYASLGLVARLAGVIAAALVVVGPFILLALWVWSW